MTKNENLLNEIGVVKLFLENAEAALMKGGSDEESKACAASVGIEAAHEFFGTLLKSLAEAKGNSMRPWQGGVKELA